MPSIDFKYQQSNITVPDVEMFSDLDLLDNKAYFASEDDLFQSLSTKLGIPLTFEEKIEEESALNILPSSPYKNLDLNLAQHDPDYLFGETYKIKNEIKSEPGSPHMGYFIPLANVKSITRSESNDLDGQISLMQDVSDSIEQFTLEISPLKGETKKNVEGYTLPSPQSFQASSDASNSSQQINIIQQNAPINQQNVQHANCNLTETDNKNHIFMWPADVAKNDKSHNMTTFPNFATVVGYTTKIRQILPSPTCQILPETKSISIQNSSSADTVVNTSAGKSTATVAFQLPQNMKIINKVSNINPAITEPVDTCSILNNDSMLCNVITSDTLNTSFQVKQNKTNSSPIIVTDTFDLLKLTRGHEEIKQKALKKQQRMIKNRESAYLSRKKRKEYVSSLEKQISDLQEQNRQLKTENEILKHRIIEMRSSITNENKRCVSLESLLKPKARRHVAILLSLAIMISINFSSLSGTFLQNIQFKTTFDNSPVIMPEIVHTRRLLWTVDENISINDQIDENFNKSMPIHPVCPVYINQSESLRLDSELRRWIGGESDNRTTSKERKLKTDSLNVVLSRSSLERLRTKSDLSHDKKLKLVDKAIDVADEYSNNNAVQVFSPILNKHASLFEALGRKDDTFYVVWFSGEHLLLPASRKNDTARPKMSLVLPAVSINGTFSTPPNHITMMQIDCEVTNTQLLHLQQSVIPVRLRNSKSASQSNRSHSVEDIVDPSVADLTKNYKPYFMKEANRKYRYRKDIT